MNKDIIYRHAGRMNKQQAINLLKNLEQRLDDYYGLNDDGKTAFGMAITALELFGNAEQLPSAQPEQIARDIATIIENEQDMRVVLKNAEHTETHSCDSERTVTHDLVSRQATIDSVCEVCENCEYFYNEKLIQTIKDLPSAEPESRHRDAQRWIPVTEEALPEDGVAVWVTIRGHDVIRCEGDETLEQAIDRIRKMVRVEGGFYVADEKTWYNAGGYPMMVQPVAWMPMEVPEPYKERREE